MRFFSARHTEGGKQTRRKDGSKRIDRWGAVPIFWFAAFFLPGLALYFAVALRNRRS